MSRSIMRSVGALLLGAVALLALYSSPALAAGPPIVSLENTSELSINTANLNGSVNPNGSSTTYFIEYGKSKLYGQTTKTRSVGSGSTSIPFSELISGLEAATTYHARLVAKNSFGTTTSSDLPWEMLLQWKVEGKPVSQFPNGVFYLGDVYTKPTLTIEGNASGQVKYTCQASTSESAWSGAKLGLHYSMSFEKCGVSFNGVAQPECKLPSVINMSLNANAVTENQLKIKNEGANCPLIEILNLGNPGFAFKAMPEKEEQFFEFSSTVPYGVNFTPWTIKVSNSTWITEGEQEEETFGIS